MLIIGSVLFLFPQSIISQIPEIIGSVKADDDDTFFGWQILPLDDQNDDGYADFIVYELIRRKAYIYLGGPTINNIPILVFDSVINGMAKVDDLNGDDFTDFTIKGIRSIDTQLNLYFGGPLLDTSADGGFGSQSSSARGFANISNDINQNGTQELIAWGADQGSIVLFELDSIFKGNPDLTIHPILPPDSLSYVIGDGIIVGYFNDDSIIDLATDLRPSPAYQKSGLILFYWGGATFDTVPDFSIKHVGTYDDGHEQFGIELKNLGDINDDGFDDIYANSHSAFSDTLGFIYFGGPRIDSIPDIIMPDHPVQAAPAGDVNHDGYPDWLTSFPLESSSFGYVNVYYGGPTVDSVWDIRINVYDLPIFTVQWGIDITGLGDINGDGIDDFAASGIKFGDTGMVVVFAGEGDPTPVKPEPGDNLPSGFSLDQNYPNPFNPTTTIAFEIPYRSTVKLEVTNLLGQHIRTLLDKPLSVGSYQIEWNGKDDDGKVVASGTYLYRLTTDHFSETKKMILVK